MKIRTHLAVLALAILVPVILFSALALNLLWKGQRASALHGLQESARATMQNVDKEIGSATAALNVLATSAYLGSGDMEAFYRQALSADLGPNAWVVLLDAQGHQVISTAVPYGTPTPAPVALEPVRQVMRTQAPFVSNLFVGRRTGNFISTVNVPVPAGDGQRYVLVEAFEPSYFKRVFGRNKLPESWLVGILDREGRFIARSLDGANKAGEKAQAELLDAIRSGPSGDLRHRTSDGREVYSAYVQSPLSGWTIVIAAPMTEIDGAARSAVLVAGIGLIAALLLATALATLLGRRLARSIAAASRSALALAKGEPILDTPSGIAEVDALHAAHREASLQLVQAQHLRTAARSEREKLIQAEQAARRRAEAENIAKDNFMAMLGHELRNPLNAMTGAIQVLESTAADPHADPERETRARLILKRQNQQLSQIVDDLLDFNRMALGKIAITARPVELCAAVQLCLDAARAGGASQPLTLERDACPAWVLADPTRLEQMISNLISNAVKFSEGDSPICVRVARRETMVELTVRDEGMGMDAALLPRIFEPFVQGPVTLERARSGLGIGLALVNQLVQLHGGTVTAASEGAGRGSVLTLSLPAVEAPQLQAHAQAQAPTVAPLPAKVAPATHDDGQAPAAQPARVLLIEDNADSREMIRILLEMEGYIVLEAEDGSSGLQRVIDERPDVAVIDVGLPGMDGYAVARAIRSSQAAAGDGFRSGLIALTGYGQQDDRRRALEAGFDVHMVKPLDIGRLSEAIRVHANDPVLARLNAQRGGVSV
jgi:signal transduction histidine kinase/ActR/RegA family two-component response regulator